MGVGAPGTGAEPVCVARMVLGQWGWRGSGAGGAVEGHRFQLSLSVIPVPGAGAELCW